MADVADNEPRDRKRSTPTTRGETPVGKPPITPLVRFKFEHQKARASYLVAAGALVFSMCIIAFIISRLGANEKIYVLDAAGNVHFGMLEDVADNKELLQTQAMLAAFVTFTRSAAGYDMAEYIKPLFMPIPQRTLDDDLNRQMKDIRTRNLQQKPVVQEVLGPVNAGLSKRMHVTGRLIRSGVFSGRALYEEVPFSLSLSFKRNDSAMAAKAYPWVISEVVIEVTEQQ